MAINLKKGEKFNLDLKCLTVGLGAQSGYGPGL